MIDSTVDRLTRSIGLDVHTSLKQQTSALQDNQTRTDHLKLKNGRTWGQTPQLTTSLAPGMGCTRCQVPWILKTNLQVPHRHPSAVGL